MPAVLPNQSRQHDTPMLPRKGNAGSASLMNSALRASCSKPTSVADPFTSDSCDIRKSPAIQIPRVASCSLLPDMQLLQVPRMSSATVPLSVTVPPDDQYCVGGNHGGDHGTQSIKRTSVSGKLITPLWCKCGSRRSAISYRLPRSAQNRTQERVLVSMWLPRNLRWIVDTITTILTLC